MHKFKKVFLGFLPLMLVAVFSLSLWQLINANEKAVWAGTMLSTVPALVFFGWSMILKKLIYNPQLHLWLPILSVSGTFIALMAGFTEFISGDSQAFYAISLAFLAGFSHVWFYAWASHLDRDLPGALVVGDALPEFVLNDGETQLSPEDLKGQPAVLIFYRGNWCPFCMAQIEELAREYRNFALSGVNFLFISPQPEKITRKLALRFDIPVRFMVDQGNKAAKALGIEHLDGLPLGVAAQGYDADTVYPTVIVTDDSGKIVYADQTKNFSLRPQPSEYLSQIL
ncbi:MAG: peroxiredoxin family protein [bacterium]